ncbi:VCBS repeat-containing protein [bacterium]|nr:VCBS repeat-containing protein [bacterium]
MDQANYWITTLKAQLSNNFLKTRVDQKSKSLNLLLSVSPFALAACGGGGTPSGNTPTLIENPETQDPEVINVLTPLEQLTNQLAQSQGLQTQFTPGANLPNEKSASGLDPANYFENSNKIHFYGYTDMTIQPARDYQGEFTPERVVTFFPEESLFFEDPKSGDQYLFINETVGYATTLNMKLVPRLFKYEDGAFINVIPNNLPDLPEMRTGGNSYLFENVDGSLGLVSSNTDSGNDLGGDILLLGFENNQILDLTTKLPISLSDELYGRQNAVNVHGMGVGDITGNGESDIVLGDIDMGIYAIVQNADSSWAIYQPNVFSWFMYDQDPNTVPENYSYRVTQLEVLDVNNDGFGDIFLSFESPGVTNKAPERSNLIYINDGNGNFSIENQIELSDPVPYVDIGSQTIDAEVIDINRDGFNDFILFSTAVDPHYAGFNIQIQINHNGTHFVDETSERLTSFQDRSVSERFNDYAYNLQYLDLNNDGHIDFFKL